MIQLLGTVALQWEVESTHDVTAKVDIQRSLISNPANEFAGHIARSARSIILVRGHIEVHLHIAAGAPATVVDGSDTPGAKAGDGWCVDVLIAGVIHC